MFIRGGKRFPAVRCGATPFHCASPCFTRAPLYMHAHSTAPVILLPPATTAPKNAARLLFCCAFNATIPAVEARISAYLLRCSATLSALSHRTCRFAFAIGLSPTRVANARCSSCCRYCWRAVCTGLAHRAAQRRGWFCCFVRVAFAAVLQALVVCGCRAALYACAIRRKHRSNVSRQRGMDVDALDCCALKWTRFCLLNVVWFAFYGVRTVAGIARSGLADWLLAFDALLFRAVHACSLSFTLLTIAAACAPAA